MPSLPEFPWPDREALLDYCRREGILGRPEHSAKCLLARALSCVMGEQVAVSKESYYPYLDRPGGDREWLPEWARALVHDFDERQMPEFEEPPLFSEDQASFIEDLGGLDHPV